MSLFDYPRINFQGTLRLNPGTANNDDYAAPPNPLVMPGGNEVLGLIDSRLVRARAYGKADNDFIEWVQQVQTFDIKGMPGQTSKQIPAEWNYYGDMTSNIISADVRGIQTAPREIYTQPDKNVPLTALLSQPLALKGHFTDVNSEGSPPATQFFIDSLSLASPDKSLQLSGTATTKSNPFSKGASQWLNFYRNANRTADAGAGAYVYSIITKRGGATINLPGFDEPDVMGAVIRYYLYLPQQEQDKDKIVGKYQNHETNPATLQIVGTIAPLKNGEKITTTPTGRLMVFDVPNIPTERKDPKLPKRRNNGPNGLIALAPAVVQQNGNLLSVDFAGTFPDDFDPATGENPKLDFGDVSLVVSSGGMTLPIGTVPYADTTGGIQKGWLFDFDISGNKQVQAALKMSDSRFLLVHDKYGTVLEETDYFVVSNQQAIYAEQGGSGYEFLNQGTTEPATVSVFHRGQELSADSCPAITVWQYSSVPIQDSGTAIRLPKTLKPGDPLEVETSLPGNFLFTFTIDDAATVQPPEPYATFMNPPFVTNWPSISLRILPNDENFDKYYVDPAAAEPVANTSLTFEILYEKVLRVYYLLYPAMHYDAFALNSEIEVARKADAILSVTEESKWMLAQYMPRTRDLSASRKQLLRAWCRAQRSPGGR